MNCWCSLKARKIICSYLMALLSFLKVFIRYLSVLLFCLKKSAAGWGDGCWVMGVGMLFCLKNISVAVCLPLFRKFVILQSETKRNIMEARNKSWGEKRTALVVLIAVVAMALEITIGLYANSMALLADGIHQATHVLVIGLSWGAYLLVRRLEARDDRVYDHDKVLGLAAYTSGVLLFVFALVIMIQAVHRFFSPDVEIRYAEALVIACIGLVVNSICATVLHSAHGKGDYNSRSAYLHVLSDVLTGIGAIIGLVCGMIWNIAWMDAVVALVSSLIIIRWAWKLLGDTGRMLTRN